MKKWAYPLAIVTGIIFIVMAFTYNTTAMNAFDDKIATLLTGNEFIILFHYIGEPIFVVAVGLIAFLYLWKRERNYHGMIFILLTFAVGSALNQVLKRIFERPRPEIIDQLTSFSFPSGHSMSGVLYLFTLAFIFSQIAKEKKKIQIVWIAAILLACLIGLSRIAESRHFATDVIAGWSMGYSWFIVCVIWYESRKKKLKKRNT
ncbi:phosphatidylglycerophosphatase [Solibacillus sp. R5-41]|uniref:phosphatase PAP2 family protein n=1 Tax=Solibacillus sp. R5-41 TaxID=2048654 RepID=UPI000C127343|nr:phosphatase PAP2 family protein [Solibacillus sp. R5-41]ATP42083.1 phosphatidylglycerophosphatase [Solibacillus sp. R5-41]